MKTKVKRPANSGRPDYFATAIRARNARKRNLRTDKPADLRTAITLFRQAAEGARLANDPKTARSFSSSAGNLLSIMREIWPTEAKKWFK